MSGFEAEYRAYCQAFGAPERIELMLCDINVIVQLDDVFERFGLNWTV